MTPCLCQHVYLMNSQNWWTHIGKSQTLWYHWWLFFFLLLLCQIFLSTGRDENVLPDMNNRCYKISLCVCVCKITQKSHIWMRFISYCYISPACSLTTQEVVLCGEEGHVVFPQHFVVLLQNKVCGSFPCAWFVPRSFIQKYSTIHCLARSKINVCLANSVACNVF